MTFWKSAKQGVYHRIQIFVESHCIKYPGEIPGRKEGVKFGWAKENQ